MERQIIYYRHLGNIEYGKAWELQEQYMQRNLGVKSARYRPSVQSADQPSSASGEDTGHYLLFCRHPHVYTLGKSGHMEHLLLNDARLKELDASFYRTNRGGDITYHGPGQIVGYPILDLERFFTDLGKYMRSLEEAVIQTLDFYGISGSRLPGATGVWIDPGTPAARKICAMGVKCSRWITMHGFALNVNTDLAYFDYIVPCGISDKGVTSIRKELGREVDEKETEAVLKQAFASVFGAELQDEPATENKEETVHLQHHECGDHIPLG